MIARALRLSSGRVCEIAQPRIPLLKHYYVLSERSGQLLSTQDIDEMWKAAHQLARNLGTTLFGDAECFTVLYNGARTRRRPWPHFHILPARSPAGKRWALLCMAVKRLLRGRPQAGTQ